MLEQQACIFIFFSHKLGDLTVRAITRSTPHDLAAKRRIVVFCLAVFIYIVSLAVIVSTAQALDKIATGRRASR
jgi:hypothetical protein